MPMPTPPEPRWTLHGPDWIAAIQRLRTGRVSGPLGTALLTPLVDHFESAWTHLRELALLAERFAPRPDQPPLPIHHLAEFVLDDVVDVFRGAASEVVQLIPSDDRSAYTPSPVDVIEESRRFDRFLTVAGLAARSSGGPDPLSETAVGAAAALEGWLDRLLSLVEPVSETLTATSYGIGNAFGSGPAPSLTH